MGADLPRGVHGGHQDGEEGLVGVVFEGGHEVAPRLDGLDRRGEVHVAAIEVAQEGGEAGRDQWHELGPAELTELVSTGVHEVRPYGPHKAPHQQRIHRLASSGEGRW